MLEKGQNPYDALIKACNNNPVSRVIYSLKKEPIVGGESVGLEPGCIEETQASHSEARGFRQRRGQLDLQLRELYGNHGGDALDGSYCVSLTAPR